MSIILVVFAFSYFCLANQNVYGKNSIQKTFSLLTLITSLILIVAFRPVEWPDTELYIEGFKNISLQTFDFEQTLSYSDNKLRYNYGESGFIWISYLFKSISDNWIIYFLGVSIVTFVFLYKFLTNYALYPIIGLLVYVSRFMLFRNMAQIRAALAIAIFLFAIKYAADRKVLPYLFITGIAASLHISLLIAIPFYWLCKYKLSTKQISFVLFCAFIFAFACKSVLSNYLQILSTQADIGQSYVGGTAQYSVGLGLLNPMIYYQSAVLIVYSSLAHKLESQVKYYNVIKNGYLFSTIILIGLSQFLVIAGRFSTIFATLEICILPAFIKASTPKYRELTILIIGVLSTFFLYNNLSKLSFFQ